MAKFKGEMVERMEPRFIQFCVGDIIEGRLEKVERIKVESGIALRYTVELDDGECVSFLGTYQIDSKLRPVDRGHFITVIYVGESKTVGKAGNAMREFEVKVSKKPITRNVNGDFSEFTVSTTGAEITDADIPF